uniref:Ectonucleoside triphosphate diphosphohydrolase 1 n=1 Tax=Chelonoidis abingdonii TaxID=106734 RepID=A0A8C0GPR8_CHEAB
YPPTKETRTSRKALLILGFLFALAAIALVAMAVSQNKPLPKNIKYGIVLDAGSSHTNLYVYEWPAEKENDTGVVHQVEVCKVEGKCVVSWQEGTEGGLGRRRCAHLPSTSRVPESSVVRKKEPMAGSPLITCWETSSR